MFLALRGNDYISAHPQTSAICPHCKEPVIAKCGDINTWHWAHKASECKYDTEPETDWHLKWKQRALDKKLIIEQRIEDRIADILNPLTNTIIEVQHSPINSDEILARTLFYRNKGYRINWVFDFSSKVDHFRFRLLSEDDNTYAFKQSWQKKSLRILFRGDDSKPFLSTSFWHFGELEANYFFDSLFKVFKKYESGNGWGRFVDLDAPFGLTRKLYEF